MDVILFKDCDGLGTSISLDPDFWNNREEAEKKE